MYPFEILDVIFPKLSIGLSAAGLLPSFKHQRKFARELFVDSCFCLSVQANPRQSYGLTR
jgi:hypothetical protein